ncbi:MAG: thiol:disulfide interchange protein DsbA/DsbL [Gammaproteobacteria bacterium]|nr:thiol:disulfide interchange protein DsbA/DsbL [Gammaproteobacteria bacterium]
MRAERSMLTLLLAAAGGVQADPLWTEGTQYFLVSPPQPTAVAAGKVEVVEIFSYACPACNHFYPVIDRLKAALPTGVQWRFLPASWHPEEDWKVFQRAYFAASSLGIADRLHDRIFDAVWKSGELATMEAGGGRLKSPLPSLADVAQYYEQLAKLEPGTFLEAAHSFSVDAQMREADAQIIAYQADSTPSLIINGKYRLTPRSAGGDEEFIALAKWLVEKEGGGRRSAGVSGAGKAAGAAAGSSKPHRQ